MSTQKESQTLLYYHNRRLERLVKGEKGSNFVPQLAEYAHMADRAFGR